MTYQYLFLSLNEYYMGVGSIQEAAFQLHTFTHKDVSDLLKGRVGVHLILATLPQIKCCSYSGININSSLPERRFVSEEERKELCPDCTLERRCEIKPEIIVDEAVGQI